jgi:hypothetical protein
VSRWVALAVVLPGAFALPTVVAAQGPYLLIYRFESVPANPIGRFVEAVRTGPSTA